MSATLDEYRRADVAVQVKEVVMAKRSDDYGTMMIFESVALGELTPEQAADLIMAKDRADRRKRARQAFTWVSAITAAAFLLRWVLS